MKSKWKGRAINWATFFMLLVVQYYVINWADYDSFGAPAVPKAVPYGCTVESPGPVNVPAEAAKIEALAKAVVANWQTVQTDPRVHAKAVQLAETLQKLHQTNLVHCPVDSEYSGYSSLTFVAKTIRGDHSAIWSIDSGESRKFPEPVILNNRIAGEPESITFRQPGAPVIEVVWSNFSQPSHLHFYANNQLTATVKGSY